MNNLPKISVITVVFNDKSGLENTIKSVVNQTYDNVEYIIIDGGSTDGTLNIIRKYEHAVNHWVSEKDAGIYHAMNKGLELSTGDWVNFMNAGDMFAARHVIENIRFNRYKQSPLVYGNKIQDGKVIYPMGEKKLEYGEIMACHQSMFFNLSASFRASVFYDLKYKIYGDYELVNRLYLKYHGFTYVNEVIAIFEGGGVSSVISGQKRKEKYRALLQSNGFFGLLKGLLYRMIKR
jgi:glycosyltransferase involved in cell wall biosynthesis